MPREKTITKRAIRAILGLINFESRRKNKVMAKTEAKIKDKVIIEGIYKKEATATPPRKANNK